MESNENVRMWGSQLPAPCGSPDSVKGEKKGGGRELGSPPTSTIRLDYATRRGRSNISAVLTNLRQTIYIVLVIHRYIRHPPQAYLKVPLSTSGVGTSSACEPSSTAYCNHANIQCATHKVWRPDSWPLGFEPPQYEVMSIAHAGHLYTLFTCFPWGSPSTIPKD